MRLRNAVLLLLFCLVGCGGTHDYNFAQTREDAIEVDIDGRIIRVIDHGEKIEMMRKGWFHGSKAISHWEDYVKAGEIATGCKITHIQSKVAGQPDHGWKEGLKNCSN
jgi:hypothetical protein